MCGGLAGCAAVTICEFALVFAFGALPLAPPLRFESSPEAEVLSAGHGWNGSKGGIMHHPKAAATDI